MRPDNTVIKSDGNIETIDPEKIINSIMKSGASRKKAEKAFDLIKKDIHGRMTSGQIHEITHGVLEKMEHKLAIRYSLKKAMMDLGPQGFIFEKYIARMLSEYGYSTKLDQTIKGSCVNHEVDVVAEKKDKIFFIECKYHNDRGIHSDVKTALYVHARFLDIVKACRTDSKKDCNYQGWLVTNTKASSDAIKYGECVGLRILAWKYPQEHNLQYYIENKKLYPVSIIPSIKKKHLDELFGADIIMIQDFLSTDPQKLMKILHIDKKKLSGILDEISLMAD